MCSTGYCGCECHSFRTNNFWSAFFSEGTFTPVSESDTHFIARLVMRDAFTHLEKLLSYIKEQGEPTLSISSLAMNLNYTTVPMTVTVPCGTCVGTTWHRWLLGPCYTTSPGKRRRLHIYKGGGTTWRFGSICGELDSSPCALQIITGW